MVFSMIKIGIIGGSGLDDPKILKESKEIIEDLIQAAINDANQKITKITQEKMMPAGNLFGDVSGAEEE